MQLYIKIRRAMMATVFLPIILMADDGGNADLIDPATFPRPSMQAVRITDEIVIDGFIDEPAWMLADSVSDFYQNKPIPGAPVSERTVARLIYDDKYLYISAVCYDSEPDKIIIESLEQEFDSQNSDAFAFALDTFNDRRKGFVFLFNPKGAIKDMQVNNDGAGVNRAWEGIVYPSARIFKGGWVLEVAVPFNTLRFEQKEDAQEWGINFMRRIRRNNEDAYWAPMETHDLLIRINKVGSLKGLADIAPSRNLSIKPFVISDRPLDKAGTKSDDIGVDLKYGLTSSLTLDLTYNTDFSQVEADDERINLTRFPLFFPEKRDFFLENSDIFTFGDIRKYGYRLSPGRYTRDFFLFHSRRIGLSDGQRIPILGGGRLSGNIGGTEIGILNMTTERAGDQLSQNFGVLRLRRPILEKSNLGVMIVNQSDGQNQNQNVGVDANFELFKRLVIYSYHAWTLGEGDGIDNSASRIAVAWRDTFWNTGFYLKRAGELFDPQVGYIKRSNINESYGTIGFHKRYRNRPILEINPYVEANQVERSDGHLETRNLSLGLDVLFLNGAKLMSKLNSNFEDVPYSFVLYGSTVTEGDYSFNGYSSHFISNQSLPISATIGFSGGGFYGGTNNSTTFKAKLRKDYRFSLEVGVQRNEIRLGGISTLASTYSAKFKFNLSTTLLNSLYMQYNEADKRLITNARINIIHAPLSDLFLVYSELLDMSNSNKRTGYVALKFTKLFGI